MTCVSLQCQNERIITRKLLDKNKKNALVSVGLESLFDRHFCEYASDMRRTRKRIMNGMEQKFQQQCLNNDDDPEVSESMQTDEMDRYLACKQRISSLFSDILSICNDVTTDEMDAIETATDAEPSDFDPAQDSMCIFCLNKEMIAEREMASHLNYLKEIKQRNLSRDEKAGNSSESKVSESYQQSLKQLSMGLNDSPSPISTPSEIQKNTANAIQTTANALLGLPPSVSDPNLFSLPMMAETLAATLLELGMQNQAAERGGFYSDFGLEFPFYSLPGYSELPKSLSKNMVTQFFDAALSLQQNMETAKCEDKGSAQSSSSSSVPSSSTPNNSNVVKVDRSEVDVEISSTSSGQGSNLEDGNTPQKKTYSSSDLQHALRDVCDGKMGTRRASLAYGVPRSTIRNHLNKIKNYGKDVAFRMLDSEGLDMCSQLSLRSKQMITELRCDDFKRQAENNTAMLLDSNQNVSDQFIKHALACQLEEYLATSAISSSSYSNLGPGVNNSYLLETDVQYVPNLRCALAAVQCSGMSISKASAIFNIHTEHIREALAST